MTGCSAIGCTNRSEKGFLMKVFPKDPIRRKEWIIRMKRENWIPTNKAALCEVHFEASMWEKVRVDGTRRLKLNAVPTLFNFTNSTKSRKPRKVVQNTTVNESLYTPTLTKSSVVDKDIEMLTITIIDSSKPISDFSVSESSSTSILTTSSAIDRDIGMSLSTIGSSKLVTDAGVNESAFKSTLTTYSAIDRDIEISSTSFIDSSKPVDSSVNELTTYSSNDRDIESLKKENKLLIEENKKILAKNKILKMKLRKIRRKNKKLNFQLRKIVSKTIRTKILNYCSQYLMQKSMKSIR